MRSRISPVHKIFNVISPSRQHKKYELHNKRGKLYHHFTVPWRVESWIDIGTAVRVHNPCPRLYIAGSSEALVGPVTYDRVKNLSFGVSHRLIPNDTLINSDVGGRAAQCPLQLIDRRPVSVHSIMRSIIESSLIHWTSLVGGFRRWRNNQGFCSLSVDSGRQWQLAASASHLCIEIPCFPREFPRQISICSFLVS